MAGDDGYGNDGTIEKAWAIKAFEDAEIHYDIITSVDPKYLKLSCHDDLIYEQFRKNFKDFDVSNIEEESLKNETAKKEWRQFCNKFEGEIENFNYGCLLRLDTLGEYSETNTTFATKIQFLAIEIARNREGHNNKLFKSALSKRIEEREKLDDVITSTEDVQLS